MTPPFDLDVRDKSYLADPDYQPPSRVAGAGEGDELPAERLVGAERPDALQALANMALLGNSRAPAHCRRNAK